MHRFQQAGERSLPPLSACALLAAASNAATRATLKSHLLITLQDRGFLFQCTSFAALNALDLLHVGLLLQIMVLRDLQKSGHRPIVLV